MQTDAVVDKRRRKFFILDNVVIGKFLPKIGHPAFIVYSVLAYHTRGDAETCFPSLSRLSAMAGYTKATVIKALETLQTEGLIEIEHRTIGDGSSTSNLYTLVELCGSNDETKEESGVHSVYRDGITTIPPPVYSVYPGSILTIPPPVYSLYPNKTQSEQDESNKTNTDSFSLVPDGKDEPRKRTSSSKPKEATPTEQVWLAYRNAYEAVYKVPPLRNAKVNGQLSKLIGRVGKETAPQLVAWFLTHRGQWYVQTKHSVDGILRDAEKLHTEWQTGNITHARDAREVDRLSSTMGMAKRIQARFDEEERLIHETA